jgi:hypothetical protein
MGKRTMVNRCVRGGGASAFGYSDSGARTVPPALNPYGVCVRESRDSAEHPARAALAQGHRADRMVQRIGSPTSA